MILVTTDRIMSSTTHRNKPSIIAKTKTTREEPTSSLLDAHATFFVAGTHCKNININTINLLIEDGNEIANHNMMDWSYENYSME